MQNKNAEIGIFRHLITVYICVYNIKGALFPKLSDERLNYPEVAFRFAVYRLNLDKSLMPDTDLVHHIQYLSPDSFQAVQKGIQYIIQSNARALM